MKRLQPVIWAKGTFLTPQHLQCQDRFIEDTLQFHTESLNFRPWGFQRLEIDHAALASGTVALTRASGIFPDGLLFDAPDSDAPPPPKSLVDSYQVDQDVVDVFLAVPHHRERGLNVSGVQLSAETRYRAEVTLMRDENTGQSEKPIQVARKNLRLMVKSEVREGTSTLCVARVQRTQSGAYQMDRTFIPPLLDFQASDHLVSIVRRLVEILAAKGGELSGNRRQKNQALANFTASDIASFWLLYTINSNFPLLNHFFRAAKGHPERVFQAMLSLAGALTTFSTDLQPRDLPKYDHGNLSFCFSDLDDKIRLLLETVVPSNFVALPLKLVQPSIYATALAEDKYLNNTRMYVAINAEMKQAELIDKAPKLLKVASATHIELLVRQALKGVPMTYVASPPNSIPVRMNYQYFSLSQSGGAWESITRARNFAAYIPADFPNPQVELIVLFPQAQ
ncbi:MAG TPA: type VI secretion system baseplate subunit TssK [Bryobacteraceae bacterium]|jgi:type VI secretion system protein ImpJ